MPTLPAGMVPSPTNYTSDDLGGVIRTEVSGGPSRYQLDWDRGSQRYTISLDLSSTQFAAWQTFYHITTKKGSIAFDMPMDTGFGLSTHSCHIVPGSYSVSRADGYYFEVSFIVETQNQAYTWTLVDAQAYLDVYNGTAEDLDLLLPRIALYANVESRVL